MLRTSGFVDDGVMFSYHGANGRESSTTLYFDEARQVVAPFGRQTTAVFGRVCQNAAPGAKSAIYNCPVALFLTAASLCPMFIRLARFWRVIDD